MQDQTIHIAFCCDRGYLMPTGVAMISVCESCAGSKIAFHVVLTDGQPQDEENLRQIAARYGHPLTIYPITTDMLSRYKCLGSPHVSVTGFARILLPDLLPPEVSRVLYLDSDVAVVGSLVPLWQTPLDPTTPMGAVIDVDGLSPKRRLPLQTPLDVPYCNSGVLLMNLDCWRREGLTATISQAALEHAFPLLDQDVLHYVLRERVLLLPPVYNVQQGFLKPKNKLMVDYRQYEAVCEAVKHPVIIHYTFVNKPWRTTACHFHAEWLKFLELSPWAGLKISDKRRIRPFRYGAERALLEAYWAFPDLFMDESKRFARCFFSLARLRHKEWLFGLMHACASLTSGLSDAIYAFNSWRQRRGR